MTLKSFIKPVAILCASLLVMAIFYWPIAYYTVLRIIVCVGALLVIIAMNKKQQHWVSVFAIIAILFNPIFPIYLYVKAYWILIDIFTAILFLWVAFLKTPNKKKESKQKEKRSYSRDKMY